MRTSLLLERTPELLQQLYQCLPEPEPAFLFDSTDLQRYQRQSPVWLQASSNAAVLERMQSAPEKWPGLILESHVPREVLLAHLREILFVHLGGRQVLLRYWSPTTASYLFNHQDEAISNRWLGPISHLCWHGSQWSRRAAEDVRWHYVINPGAAAWERPASCRKIHLDAFEEAALQRQQKEQLVYRWWRKQNDISFPEAAAFLEEGLSQGFVDARELEEYLSIRALCPRTQTPSVATHGSNDERLFLFRRSVTANCQNKESPT